MQKSLFSWLCITRAAISDAKRQDYAVMHHSGMSCWCITCLIAIFASLLLDPVMLKNLFSWLCITRAAFSDAKRQDYAIMHHSDKYCWCITSLNSILASLILDPVMLKSLFSWLCIACAAISDAKRQDYAVMHHLGCNQWCKKAGLYNYASLWDVLLMHN